MSPKGSLKNENTRDCQVSPVFRQNLVNGKFGNWVNEISPRPSADRDWDWVTQGLRLDHAWATQASRLGHPWVELNKCFICNKSRKMGVGVPSPESSTSHVIAAIGKAATQPRSQPPSKPRSGSPGAPGRRDTENSEDRRTPEKARPTPIWDGLGCGELSAL